MTPLMQDSINDLEFQLNKCKFITEHFPDAHPYGGLYSFKSKLVNQNYQKIDFYKASYYLDAVTYNQLEFKFNNKKEQIRIYSIPKNFKLIYTRWDKSARKSEHYFSNFEKNIVKNKFNDDILNYCKLAISEWIDQYPNIKVNDKNLSPSFKKMLVIS